MDGKDAGSDGEGFVVVLVTAPDPEKALAIGSALVEERLAACANLVPGIQSVYWWKGKVQTDGEVLLLLKTRRELFAQLEARVRALHPYEVPEIIALAVDRGSAPYLQWIAGETRPRERG